jgi:hypothetical protein
MRRCRMQTAGESGGRDVFRLTKTIESGWRIETPVPPPVLSVQTAIREMEVLLKETAEPEVRRSATRSLELLRLLTREKH